MLDSNSKGFITIILVGMIVLGGFLFVGGTNLFKDIKKPLSDQTYRVDDSSLAINPEKKSLQLDNFGFIALPTNTPTPTLPPGVPSPTPTNPIAPPPVSPSPTNPVFPPPASPSPPTAPIPTSPFIDPPAGTHYCLGDIPRDATCECDPRFAKPGVFCSVTDICYYDESPDGCSSYNRSGCLQNVCVEKPVIYLYTTKKTLVDVVIKVPGKIVISDPLYPSEGWKDVEAHPNGTLFYQGKKYKELFYESSIIDVKQPKAGIFISREHLKEKLGEYISQLGLIGREHRDFMDYWIPRLQELDKPYVLFSILEREEKLRIDTVEITPKPDTFIEFIAYFKGVETIFPIIPLMLSDQPQERKGFTAVEWGGLIEPQK